MINGNQLRRLVSVGPILTLSVVCVFSITWAQPPEISRVNIALEGLTPPISGDLAAFLTTQETRRSTFYWSTSWIPGVRHWARGWCWG